MIEVVRREPAISGREIRKSYVSGDGSLLHVLQGVDLDVYPGESVAIIGESGSGKSTLLHILGGLDRPTEGEVKVGGHDLHRLRDDELSALRNASIGFVFQFHHLLREFTVLENVILPQLIGGKSHADASRRARHLLGEVGLESRLTHKPAQLSGGEQQRVAVARALANQPIALLADEPSGNLDPGTSDRLHDLLFAVAADHGTAMILVTHNMGLASRSHRVLEVEGGKLVNRTDASSELPRRTAG
jgi:lipoprotein-releasing system ATP-binding protein